MTRLKKIVFVQFRALPRDISHLLTSQTQHTTCTRDVMKVCLVLRNYNLPPRPRTWIATQGEGTGVGYGFQVADQGRAPATL